MKDLSEPEPLYMHIVSGTRIELTRCLAVSLAKCPEDLSGRRDKVRLRRLWGSICRGLQVLTPCNWKATEV